MNPSILVDLEFDALYSEIGNALIDNNALQNPFEELVKIGKEWFEINLEKIQKIICNSQFQNLLNQETDTSKLIVLLADVIGTNFTQIPVFSVSAIILKMGINKFCLIKSR